MVKFKIDKNLIRSNSLKSIKTKFKYDNKEDYCAYDYLFESQKKIQEFDQIKIQKVYDYY